MRTFVVSGHDAPTTPDFSLDDLAGGAGRLDVLCRCINSAFFLSHSIREDARLYLVLSDEITLRFEGSELRHLNPDERSTAALVRKSLESKDEAFANIEVETSPGIHLSKRGFEDVVEEVADTGDVIQLHEDGDPITQTGVSFENPVFVLSDHHDFTDGELEILKDVSDYRVKLSPRVLHADHSITVANNYLDTRGFSEY